jgi:outer membrane protein assembly factor BamB/tRNA A-37 threonylcarbamoyl transferase component Bud32
LGGCVLETNLITQDLTPEEDPGSEKKLKPGTVLEERYQIESLIGAGGMSAVYRARDLRFSVIKPVAVKEMINRGRDDFMREAAVSIFEREANILASLHHPAIPKIYDYFTYGLQSYLVMEYIQGYNLETIINKSEGFLSEPQVIKWAIDLCDVLNYLHNHEPQPIIFRDIKPANIILTPDKRVVLVDFGIAKAFQYGQKGTMIGTEGYSPPEQYRGEAAPGVDIYALGATLHHSLTKKDPRVETPFTFSERPIREINPNVSVELETVVTTALQYNASDRFEDAATMKEALVSIAKKTGILTNVGKTETILKDQLIKPLWTFDCEDEIRGSARVDDGVLYVGAYDNNLYAIDALTGEFIWKYPTDGGIVSKPAVYEKNIYFGSEDERLHVISPHSGRVVWTYYTEGPIRSSPHIADRHVFIGSDDAHVHIINAATGRRALKVDLGAPIRSTPLVAGENIFVGAENGEFFCLDFRGKIKWRVRAKRAITSSPTIANDIVFFGSVDGILYAVDAKSGWGIWQFRMERGTVSSPRVEDHLVFIGSADNNIYCVDIRSNKEVWRFTTDHQVSSTPMIYQGAIYCGGVDGYFYCLDLKSGHLRWKFETGGPITGSPTIQDDIVYFGSTDNRLYAIPT